MKPKLVCPHCGQELHLYSFVIKETIARGWPTLYATPCCRQPVEVSPHVGMKLGVVVDPVVTDATQDSWGVAFLDMQRKDVTKEKTRLTIEEYRRTRAEQPLSLEEYIIGDES